MSANVSLASVKVGNSNQSQIIYKGMPVVTTDQLAEFYGTQKNYIAYNFSYNRERFQEIRDFFKLTKGDLKAFKSGIGNSNVVASKTVNSITLWTKRGAFRHAKMLNTERAWEVFEMLEENYFNPPTRQVVRKDDSEFDRLTELLHKAIEKITGYERKIKNLKELTGKLLDDAVEGDKYKNAILKLNYPYKMHSFELSVIDDLEESSTIKSLLGYLERLGCNMTRPRDEFNLLVGFIKEVNGRLSKMYDAIPDLRRMILTRTGKTSYISSIDRV